MTQVTITYDEATHKVVPIQSCQPMLNAAADYFESVGGSSSTLPGQFFWHRVWSVMLAARPTPPLGVRGSVEGVPITMLLFCPKCGIQHIDEPDERTPDWDNPPHRSHLCHACGCIWRPADVATVGVVRITTEGKADNWGESNSAALAIATSVEADDVERVAQHVYEAMRWAADQSCTDKHPTWVPRGNSFAQDKARDAALAALAALPPSVEGDLLEAWQAVEETATTRLNDGLAGGASFWRDGLKNIQRRARTAISNIEGRRA